MPTAIALETSLLQRLPKLVHEQASPVWPSCLVVWVPAALEGSGVHPCARQHSSFGAEGLQQHADGHAGWEGMGVDEQVWPAQAHTKQASAGCT